MRRLARAAGGRRGASPERGTADLYFNPAVYFRHAQSGCGYTSWAGMLLRLSSRIRQALHHSAARASITPKWPPSCASVLIAFGRL